MKKIIGLILLFALLLPILSGCVITFNKSDLTDVDAKQYLENKYQGSTFSFVENSFQN